MFNVCSLIASTQNHELTRMKNKITYTNILKVIGNTPLMDISLGGENKASILAKLEFLNPSGSVKDRMALYMVEKAEKRGTLRSGMTIIEATTGNTGISLAMMAAIKGYRMIVVMPENMSRERRQMIEAFGAKVILTATKDGPNGAIEKRDRLAKEIANSWVPGQFENEDNVLAHQLGLGREIVEQTGGKVDAFVAGVGTGGTLVGVAKALRAVNPKVLIVAVEPAESAVLSNENPGQHNIQGIGEGFIPQLVDLKLIDQVFKVSTRQAEKMTRLLAKKEGILTGTSAGANVAASRKISKKLRKGKIVVTILPDRGERYLSENLFFKNS